MKQHRIGAWVALGIGVLYFEVQLICTFEFTLRKRRGEYSFHPYRVVIGDPQFQATFT